MKTFLSFAFLAFAINGCRSLRCWECNNANTNEDCLAKGRLRFCTEVDAICEDQVRHSDDGLTMIIEKRCKQSLACQNNVIQNVRPAYPIQCYLNSPTSVCRCCCSTDGCNRDLLTCWHGIPTVPPPVQEGPPACRKFPSVPENANMQCQGNYQPGSTCQYKCHDNHYMVGEPLLTCLSNGSWDRMPPQCHLKRCLPETFELANGEVSCSNKNYYRSRCTFKCNTDFGLVGSEYLDCVDAGSLFPNRGVWSRAVPRCKPLVCPNQGPILHGSFSCTRGVKFNSVCTWQCDRNYEIFPKGFEVNTCLITGSWNRPWPCCTLPCLPYAIVDLMVILDSSSSVGSDNWRLMTGFVESLFRKFALQPDAAQFSVFRYNAVVDETTAIFFSSFPNNIDAFIDAFHRIPYDGTGTNTGRAVSYAARFALDQGNRQQAPDIVLLITDGNSNDEVSIPGRILRRRPNTEVKVIPVAPPGGGSINIDDLVDIAGSRENVITVALETGFAALDENFAASLAQDLCPPPCSNPFRTNPLERMTPARLLKYVDN